MVKKINTFFKNRLDKNKEIPSLEISFDMKRECPYIYLIYSSCNKLESESYKKITSFYTNKYHELYDEDRKYDKELINLLKNDKLVVLECYEYLHESLENVDYKDHEAINNILKGLKSHIIKPIIYSLDKIIK